MLRAFAFLILVGLLGGAGYYLYTREGKPAQSRQQATPVVIVEALTKRELVDQIEAVGTTYAKDTVTLTAPVTDPVIALQFEDGQKVKAGDILVKLDSRIAEAQQQSARATLIEAQKQLDRISTLTTRGASTETRLDEQERIRDTAKAEVDRMAAEIDRRKIRAPFDGIVGLKRVSLGLMVEPGTELVTLIDTSVLKLDFAIPELYLANVKPGQEIIGKSPVYPDRTFAGKISAVEGLVDPVSRAVTVRALIPNKDGLLTPGMLMTVNVIRERAKVLLAPEEAVISLGEQRYLFKVENGDTVRRVAVKTGRRKPGYIEITEGLNEGDVIVVDGVIRVRDGGKIRAQQRPANGGSA